MRTVSSHQSLAGAAFHPARVLSLAKPCSLHLFAFLCLLLAFVAAADDEGAWIRPQNAGDPLIWGRKDGILFGLPSEGGFAGALGDWCAWA